MRISGLSGFRCGWNRGFNPFDVRIVLNEEGIRFQQVKFNPKYALGFQMESKLQENQPIGREISETNRVRPK
ncbi:hypothetical protein SAMN05444412_101221 [Rhodonellum ikkaensis]|nr:hypothetical protein SAMN05444412_101221 [Rhodonellum ikkaensis]